MVCLKPAGVNSTDVPGGLPELLRSELGQPKADLRTVHRLDQVVGGVMVLARSAEAASELSRQVRNGQFQKEYLTVCHFRPAEDEGIMWDILWRDPRKRKTKVVKYLGKGAQEAELEYWLLERREGLSLVRVRLITGRTHQIRTQFSSRGLPLYGDRKYSKWPDDGPIALWSHRLEFLHPETGEAMTFSALPPQIQPWTAFEAVKPQAAED